MFVCDLFHWLLSVIFSGFVLEIIVYVVIDKSTKDRLNVAKSSLEKHKIWLDECLLLLFISFITWFHHFPYFLFTMIFCTIATLVVSNRTGLGSWFQWLVDCYKEFKEHEESVSRMKSDLTNSIQPIETKRPTHPLSTGVVIHHSQVSPHPPMKMPNRVLVQNDDLSDDDCDENIPPPNVTLIKPSNSLGSGVVKFAPDVVQINHRASHPQAFNQSNQFLKPKVEEVSPFSPSSWVRKVYSSILSRPPIHQEMKMVDKNSINTVYAHRNKTIFNNADFNRHETNKEQFKLPVSILKRNELIAGNNHHYNNHLHQQHQQPQQHQQLQQHHQHNPIQLQAMFQPRGLKNNKENLCFFNCIIQVLARTDKLVMELMRILGHLRSENPILSEIVNVFATLTNPDPNLTNPLAYPQKLSIPVDTTNLRIALLSSLPTNKQSINSNGDIYRNSNAVIGGAQNYYSPQNGVTVNGGGGVVTGGGSLLQMPGCGRQMEQDVAEMFMWMIDKLNVVISAMQEAKELHRKSEYYAQYLILKSKYNNPNRSKINQLREFHMMELKSGDCPMLTRSLYKQEQTIADLDWLLYKESPPTTNAGQQQHQSDIYSTTIIDDLFTGQLSFSTFCSRCHCISMTTDIFKILPLAVPTTDSAACVSIEECLQHLTKVDSVVGPDPIMCHFCASKPAYLSTPNGGLAFKSLKFTNASPDMVLASSPKIDQTPPAFANPTILDFLSPIKKDNGGVCVEAGPVETPLGHVHSPFASSTCVRQTMVTRLPDYLVIQLMKFQVDPPNLRISTTTSKLVTKIKLSSRPIDIKSLVTYCSDDVADNGSGTQSSRVFHQLYAVILHSSRNECITDGHYRALIRTNKTTWHMFDDEHVTCVDDVDNLLLQDYIQQNAYLLFYHKLSD